jgi:hypothetical protein
VKPFANRLSDRDVIPFEVIEMISSITLVVRDMASDLDSSFKPHVFMSQCLNNEDQSWTIKPDPKGLSFRIRYLKSGEWKDVSGNKYELADEPRRWHQFGLL